MLRWYTTMMKSVSRKKNISQLIFSSIKNKVDWFISVFFVYSVKRNYFIYCQLGIPINNLASKAGFLPVELSLSPHNFQKFKIFM